MRVALNGETRNLEPGTTLRGLLELLELGGERVAVAVNEEVVRREEYGRKLHEGDRIEVIHAVAGG